MGPQTLDSFSRNTEVQARAGCLPLKMSPEMCELRPVDSCRRSPLPRAWGEAGCPAVKLPPAICELGGAGSQRIKDQSKPISPSQCRIRFGPVVGGLNTRKMAPVCRLLWRRTQQRDNSDCSSSPHSEAKQLSLSLNVSGTSRAAISLPEPRVSALAL